MKKFLTAIALTIAIPAAAFAQAAPATAAKADCCEKMKDMTGCKDMAGMTGMSHTGHDMKAGADMPAGHAMMHHSAVTPQADPRQTTKQ